MSLIYWPMISGPVAQSSGLAHDPFFSSVVQLAHFDGTNGSTTYTNSCSRGNTLANTGSLGSLLTTSSPKWGTACLNNPNSGIGNGLRGATHADYNFSTSDWTVEFWVNPTTLNDDFNATKIYFDMRDSSLTAAWVPNLNDGGLHDGTIRYVGNGVARITSAAGAITAGVFQHVALCRASGTTRLFVNGTQVGSNFTDSNTYVQNQMSLGIAGNGGGSCVGKFDDLRVTNGVGRYAANFSIPSGAFPNS